MECTSLVLINSQTLIEKYEQILPINAICRKGGGCLRVLGRAGWWGCFFAGRADRADHRIFPLTLLVVSHWLLRMKAGRDGSPKKALTKMALIKPMASRASSL